MKYETDEERHTYDSKGNAIYKSDMYGIAKQMVDEAIRKFEYQERMIWRPKLNTWRGKHDGYVYIE
ncbi:MAG: hypothetical protein WBP64_10695 [Nitrososphaeraceae archaeon]